MSCLGRNNNAHNHGASEQAGGLASSFVHVMCAKIAHASIVTSYHTIAQALNYLRD